MKPQGRRQKSGGSGIAPARPPATVASPTTAAKTVVFSVDQVRAKACLDAILARLSSRVFWEGYVGQTEGLPGNIRMHGLLRMAAELPFSSTLRTKAGAENDADAGARAAADDFLKILSLRCPDLGVLFDGAVLRQRLIEADVARLRVLHTEALAVAGWLKILAKAQAPVDDRRGGSGDA